MISPGQKFATASVPVTATVQPTEQDGVTPRRFFARLQIRANPGNNGLIYVCNTALNPDKTLYLNVIDVLEASQIFLLSSEINGLAVDLQGIFVGADNFKDFVVAYVAEI